MENIILKNYYIKGMLELIDKTRRKLRYVYEVKSSIKLSRLHYFTIMMLDDDGMTMNNISYRNSIKPQQATRVVTELRDKGLVSTFFDSTDKRSVVVRLTSLGMSLKEELTEMTTDIYSKFLTKATETELQQCYNTINSLLQYIREDNESYIENKPPVK